MLSTSLIEILWPTLSDEQRSLLPVLISFGQVRINPTPETLDALGARVRKSRRSVKRILESLDRSGILIWETYDRFETYRVIDLSDASICAAIARGRDDISLIPLNTIRDIEKAPA